MLNGFDFAVDMVRNRLSLEQKDLIANYQNQRKYNPELVEDFEKGANLIAEEVVLTINPAIRQKIIRMRYCENKTNQAISDELCMEKHEVDHEIRRCFENIENIPSNRIKLWLIIELAVGAKREIDLSEIKRYFSEGFIARITTTTVTSCVTEAFQAAIEEGSNDIGTIDVPISELNLSRRAYNCLMRGRYETIGDVKKADPEDLMKMRNFGKVCLVELQNAIEKYCQENNL